jgi:hypothetical protein
MRTPREALRTPHGNPARVRAPRRVLRTPHGSPASARTPREVLRRFFAELLHVRGFRTFHVPNSSSCARTKGSSAHRASSPATWSTTSGPSIQIPHRTPPRGRATGQLAHRNPPRGQPPAALCCRFRIEPLHVGEQAGCERIETFLMVDHLSPFNETCVEPVRVVDHQTRFSHIPESSKHW